MKKINQQQLTTTIGGLSPAQCYGLGVGFLFIGPIWTGILVGSGAVSSCWNS